MTQFLAQADAVFLMSWFKPIVFVLVLAGWAWIIAKLDKDAEHYYLKRMWINLGQMVIGIIGFWLMLLIPIFFVGLLVGVLLLASGILGYVFYRNTQVPPDMRWTFSLDSFKKRMERMHHAQAERKVSAHLMTAKGSPIAAPDREDPNLEVHHTLEDLLEFALPRGGDLIEVGVDSSRAVLAVTVDGVRYPQPEVEPKAAMQLIDYIKGAADLDVADRRKKQTATLRVNVDNRGEHRLDIETAGSTRSVSLTVQIDPVVRSKREFKQLGLTESQMERLKPVLEERGKVVLVTAPPRHGLTTTLYSLIQTHDPYMNSVVMFQEEKPFEVEGVSFRQITEGANSEQVAEEFGALLRSDPDVVLMPRPLEPAVAQLAAKNAEEIRLYLAMNEANVFGALSRWAKLLGDRQLVADSLGAIIAQRLVRKLCPTCKTSYTPNPQALKKLNLPADRVSELYQASGKVIQKDEPVVCPTCHGMGYFGRTGVFEIMILDDKARELIANGDADRLRAYLRKRRMLWLQESALAKVVEGVTDIREVTRVLTNGRPASGSSRPAGSSSAGE